MNLQQTSKFYSPHSATNANNNQRLQKLKCVFCNTDKPLDAFSQTQISKATFNPYAPPSYNKKPKQVTCKTCTSRQNTHLTCMMCNKRQPLDKFAKSQRRNAEKARCRKCIEKREKEDVWASDPDTDSDDEYDF
ncbi:hypothetical protein RMATCC62417_08833 [Rhizopus microsporus]|nr:hypothetical protein RMATCC62417_08833 [Rhizopus microsporus]